ncbi:MAG: hypothetical protein FWD83_07695, partial [Promicromonosporaceae bacterium]|nr:hypothetical protein [Promicromonosporaceae bacterium]
MIVIVTRFISRPTRRTRKSFAVAAATVMALMATLLGTAAPAAAAVAVPNPRATVTLTHAFDGTGHGTADATFVHTGNGFAVGDDGPNDGVVSSGDVVGLYLSIAFAAGPARQVIVAIDTPLYLEWRTQGDLLCRDGHFVQAFRQGSNCVFLVPSGAVETIEVPLVLHARDTGGRIVTGQQVRVNVRVPNGAVFQEATAGPYTVVSVPVADVILHSRSFPLSPTGNRWMGASPIAWNSPAVGHFTASPRPLQRVGYSPSKGMSAGGQWSGYLDVTDFPESTTWQVNGADVAPNANGLLPLGSNRGDVRIDFNLNAPWPDMEVGSTMDFVARVIVNPGSFSVPSPSLLNNGTDWQPGDGQGSGYSTQNPALGSLAGRPFANNDYSAIRVNRPFAPPPGAIINKTIMGPWNPSYTIWEDQNIFVASGSSLGVRTGTGQSASSRVALGTELFNVLSVLTQNAGNNITQMVVGDRWSNADQTFDMTRSITVTLAGQPVPAELWRVEFHQDAATNDSIGNPNVTAGWTANPGVNPQSVRVIFEPGAIPTGDAEGAGLLQVRVPTTIRTDLDPVRDGSMVANTMVWGRTSGQAGEWQTGTFLANVTLAFPRVPSVHITNRVNQIGNYPAGTNPTATIRDQVEYRVVATINGMPRTTEPVTPVITIDLDRCVVNPVNTTAGWTMTVIAAVPGPSGRVCGDLYSTPAQLVFTPTGSDTRTVRWTNRSLGNGEIGVITYRVQVAGAVANGTRLGNIAHIEIDEAPLPDLAEAPVTVEIAARTAAALWRETPREQIEDLLSWSGEVLVYREGEINSADAVIVLPRMGDGVLFDPDHDVGGYEGPRESDFHGTYTVSHIGLDQEHSTPGARLYITTNPNADFNPATSTWIYLGAATPAQRAAATAVRVITPPTSGPNTAIINITINPTGNRPDDVYVMWMGPTTTPGAPVYPPFPQYIVVFASELSGLVWWDDNNDGHHQVTEQGIANVRVTLHAANPDGSPGAQLAYTHTDANGRYSFSYLLAGNYVTVVHRGTQIPAGVTTFYNENRPVVTTYSARGQFHAASREQSTAITVPRDGAARNVDFGFHRPDPMIALDKSEATVNCEYGLCQIYWDVTVTNKGTTPLTDVVLTDRMTDNVFNVTATGMATTPIAYVHANNNTTFAISRDGSLLGWGNPRSGVFGFGEPGSTVVVLTPQRVRGVNGYITNAAHVATEAHAAGRHRVVMATTDGYVYTWGLDPFDPAAPASTPTRVPGLSNIVQVAIGTGSSSFALSADGTVYSWGPTAAPNLFMLGTGDSAVTHLVPTCVVGTDGQGCLRDIASLATFADGIGVAVAVTRNGAVYAWGPNSNVNIATGLEGPHVPQRILGLPPITDIDISNNHAIAVAANTGVVYVWGLNSNGLLGVGHSNAQLTPAPVVSETGAGQLTGITQVAARNGGSFALREDGVLLSWGSNPGLGNGTVGRAVPTPVHGLSGAGSTLDNISSVHASTNPQQGFAITNNGQVVSWGDSFWGGLGHSHTPQVNYPRPVLAVNWQQPLRNVVQIDGGSQFSMGLTSRGNVYAWGIRTQGQLGDGMTDGNRPYAAPVLSADGTGPLSDIAQISAGMSHALARTTGGFVYAWGQGGQGRLGNGLNANQSLPVRVLNPTGTGYLQNIVYISVTSLSSFAVDSNGYVFAWGSGANGRLGNGGTIDQNLPVRVEVSAGVPLTDIVQVSLGASHALAVSSNGDVFAWGHRADGRLGNNTTGNQWEARAVRVHGVGGVGFLNIGSPADGAYVQAAEFHSIALTAGGDVLSWGSQARGVLGGFPGGNRLVPGRTVGINGVGYLSGVAQISSGRRTVLALMTDGRVVAWGVIVGQFEDDWEPVFGPPTLLENLPANVIRVVDMANTSRNAVITSAGAAYMWGEGGQGSLGNPITGFASIPMVVSREPLGLGTELFPGLRLTPTSSSRSGGWLSEVFVLPGVLFGGDVRVVRFEGWSRMGDAEQVVVNQAFVDSPLTPITGVPA